MQPSVGELAALTSHQSGRVAVERWILRVANVATGDGLFGWVGVVRARYSLTHARRVQCRKVLAARRTEKRARTARRWTRPVPVTKPR